MAAVATNAPLSMPTQGMPLIGDDGLPTQPWWRFWYGLFVRNASTIPYLVSTALTAEGTTQADALALASEWNVISSTPANSGARLNAFGIGLDSTVINNGGAALKVYPPIGSQIDALGTNAPYSLADTKIQVFYQVSDTQFYSQQLG